MDFQVCAPALELLRFVAEGKDFRWPVQQSVEIVGSEAFWRR